MTIYEKIQNRIAELEKKGNATCNGSTLMILESAINELNWVLSNMRVEEAEVENEPIK